MARMSNDPRTYMDEAERYLKDLFAGQDLLRVLRIKDCSKGEMILVGMVDEKQPTKPSDLIFLKSYLVYTGSVAIEFRSGFNHIESCTVSFGSGRAPLEYLKKYANKVFDVL